jgi:hypothetical protein
MPVSVPDLLTPLESNAGSRYSDGGQIDVYLRALSDAAGGRAALASIGRSAGGRDIPALLCGLEPHGRIDTGKLRVMLVGSIHGASEAAGCEALLGLARDVLLGARRDLLGHLELIVIPSANPDGRAADSFRNGNAVNINRDFVLLEQPESQALDAAVRRYAPAVVLDAHEQAVLKRKTLGAAGYFTAFEAQFDVASTPAIPQALRQFATATLLPQLIARTQSRGLPAQRYIAEIKSLAQPVTHGDLTLRTFRNKSGLRGPLSVLLETPMEPKAGQYATFRDIGVRVQKQRLCQEVFLDCVRDNARAIAAARAQAVPEIDDRPFPVNARYRRDPADATLRVPLRERANGGRIEASFADHRAVEAHDLLIPPAAWYITAHTDLFAALLARHGIAFEVLHRAVDRPVVSGVHAGGDDPDAAGVLLAERHHTRTLPAGALCVAPSGWDRRLLALLLDPRSASSVFRYTAYARLLAPGEPGFICRAA